MRTSWLFIPILGLALVGCDGLFGPWKKDNPSCSGTDCTTPPSCTTGDPGCPVVEDMGVAEPCVASVCSSPPCWESVCLPDLRGHVPTAMWINSVGKIYLTTKGGKIFTVTLPGGAGGGAVSDEPIGVRTMPVALNGIFGTSDSDIWAVGGDGQALHFLNSGAWAVTSSIVLMPLLDVSATNSNNVYAVGSAGQLVLFDGSRWNNKGAIGGPLRGVWASPTAEAYCVGDNGAMHKYTPGGGPMAVGLFTSKQLNDIWGRSTSDIWVAGGTATDAVILHYPGTGTQWDKPLDEDGQPGLTSVWGDGLDVWFVGHAGRIVRVRGGQVIPETSTTDTLLTAVYGTPGGGVFAVGANGVLLRRRAN